MAPQSLKSYYSWRPRPGETGGDGLHSCLGAQENTKSSFHSSTSRFYRGFYLQIGRHLKGYCVQRLYRNLVCIPTPQFIGYVYIVKPVKSFQWLLHLLLLLPQLSKEYWVKLGNDILKRIMPWLFTLELVEVPLVYQEDRRLTQVTSL